jgi:hypothetical protein
MTPSGLLTVPEFVAWNAPGQMRWQLIDDEPVAMAPSHPAVTAWLQRIAALPGWMGHYDLLPGKRMGCYAGESI